MTLNLNTLLLEIGGRRVLLEAGAGTTMGPNGGRLFDNLRALDLSPADIDVVVVSHTHPDHVGNLRTADGGKAFPRATAMAHGPTGHSSSRAIRISPTCPCRPTSGSASPRTSSRAWSRSPATLNSTRQVPKSCQALPQSPHPATRPGWAASSFIRGPIQLLLTADLAYHPVVNIDRPWRPGPDRDQEAAEASRRRIFDRAAAERMLVLGFHYPFPGLGRILRTDSGYVLGSGGMGVLSRSPATHR